MIIDTTKIYEVTETGDIERYIMVRQNITGIDHFYFSSNLERIL